jgi:hypothetical protein
MTAATCALLLQLEPNLAPDRAEEVILYTATTGLQWGEVTPDDSCYGCGMLNALEAVSQFNKGDVDNSRLIDILDVNYLEDYIYMSGPAPIPLPEIGDLDCSGNVDIEDMIILINYLNNGGPAPEPCQ